MGRTPCCEKVGLRSGRWTAEEDEILRKYIEANGEGSWRSLPKNAGLLRCGKSCRLRWINYLRSDLKRGNITVEEEDIIINLHASLGNRWSLIAGYLPGRTDNEIKNYWNSHLSRKIQSYRRPNPHFINNIIPPPAKPKKHIKGSAVMPTTPDPEKEALSRPDDEEKEEISWVTTDAADTDEGIQWVDDAMITHGLHEDTDKVGAADHACCSSTRYSGDDYWNLQQVMGSPWNSREVIWNENYNEEEEGWGMLLPPPWLWDAASDQSMRPCD